MMNGKFSFKRKLRTINRFRFILAAIFEAGGGLLLGRMRLRQLVPLKCRISRACRRQRARRQLIEKKDGSRGVSPVVLRELLERLGPTFIKFGQILSLRADIVGEDIAKELSKLQSEAPPFPYEQAASVIKQEFQKMPEELFDFFETEPVAAASLAQVHRAVLKGGVEAAVKIQRPNIKSMMAQDIGILLYLARLAERFIGELRPLQPVKIVREFADWTMRELDFRAEGHHADRFLYLFKENQHINIPKIHWAYTSPKVLTMDFVDGVKLDNIEALHALGIDAKKLALHGIDALFHQFFIYGFFHADPHPGNFFALPGDVLCLHDFGMVGYLSRDQRKELISCFVAFNEKDIEGFTKHFFHIAQTTKESDVQSFTKDISEIMSEFFFSRDSPSVAQAFFRLVNSGVKRGVRFPTDFVLFGKALITTEAMGLLLYPDFDFNEQFKPFINQALQVYLGPKKMLKEAKADLFDYLEFLKQLPEQAQRLLNRFEHGMIGVKVDAQELFDLKEEFDRQNDVRILAMLAIGVLLATIGFLYLEGQTRLLGAPLSLVGALLSAFLFILMFVKIHKGPRRISKK